MDIKNIINQHDSLFQKTGVRNLQYIKKRENGMTSSGVAHMCHWNVAKLVMTCGGLMSTGYAVEFTKQGSITLIPHSIWVTPEGKRVCVTNSGGNDNQFLFAETETFDPYGSDFVKCFILKATSKNITVHCGINKGLKINLADVSKFAHYGMRPNDSFILSEMEKRNWDDAGFELPSSANGLVWDELFSRIPERA